MALDDEVAQPRENFRVQGRRALRRWASCILHPWLMIQQVSSIRAPLLQNTEPAGGSKGGTRGRPYRADKIECNSPLELSTGEWSAFILSAARRRDLSHDPSYRTALPSDPRPFGRARPGLARNGHADHRSPRSEIRQARSGGDRRLP